MKQHLVWSEIFFDNLSLNEPNESIIIPKRIFKKTKLINILIMLSKNSLIKYKFTYLWSIPVYYYY
jgi:hypothetical protein